MKLFFSSSRALVLVVVLLFFSVCSLSAGKRDLSYFFPSQIGQFDKDVLSPDDFFGVASGELHLNYEMVYSYFRYLESVSDRITLEVLGKTYESRPYIMATISSKINISNIDVIRQAHMEKVLVENIQFQNSKRELNGNPNVDSDRLPVVNWLGYSVHGNEATGVNASVLVAYALVAGTDDFVQELLDNNIVLMLPALNPDGMSRYSTWVNSNLSYAVNTDELGREFREPAPSSRSNHYWYDLNRDWLLAQHPEGRAILSALHKWHPAIVSDFHEHGSATGTFFSPGIRNSTNKVIHPDNWQMTDDIAEFHRDFMEDIGTLYFSRENYDDFYPGKGGAYPDLLGSIGILYEQPNPRGLNREREGTVQSLALVVRNQVYCSFSALAAGAGLKAELDEYRENYKEWLRKEFARFKGKGYIFTAFDDLSLTNEFLSLLRSHDIDYHALKSDFTSDGVLYPKERSFVVPMEQESLSVIRTLFECERSYKDSIFYDVSAWTVALAYNLTYNFISVPVDLLDEAASSVMAEMGNVTLLDSASFAYLFEMDDFYSYNFLYYLLEKGVYLKASDSPFWFDPGDGLRLFGSGTIMIPSKLQRFCEGELLEVINGYFQSVRDNGFVEFGDRAYDRGFIEKGVVKLYPVSGGKGVEFDLGSNHFRWISMPSVALLVGEGANYGVVGELWHLLDWKFRIPVTLLDVTMLDASALSKYNVIIATGDYKIPETKSQMLVDWSRSNLFVGIGNGVRFASDNGLMDIKMRNLMRPLPDNADYAYRLKNRRYIAFPGVIMQSRVDLSHPLAIGMKNEFLPVFRRGSSMFEELPKSTIAFSRISDSPLLSGLMYDFAIEQVKNTPYVIGGRGVVLFPDSPFFRGYWYGTARTFMNALFFRELL